MEQAKNASMKLLEILRELDSALILREETDHHIAYLRRRLKELDPEREYNIFGDAD